MGNCLTSSSLYLWCFESPAEVKPEVVVENVILELVEEKINSMLSNSPIALAIVHEVENVIHTVINRSRPSSRQSSPAVSPFFSRRKISDSLTLPVISPKTPQRTIRTISPTEDHLYVH